MISVGTGEEDGEGDVIDRSTTPSTISVESPWVGIGDGGVGDDAMRGDGDATVSEEEEEGLVDDSAFCIEVDVFRFEEEEEADEDEATETGASPLSAASSSLSLLSSAACLS